MKNKIIAFLLMAIGTVASLQAQRQMCAALVAGDGVNLIDDHRAHWRQQRSAAVARSASSAATTSTCAPRCPPSRRPGPAPCRRSCAPRAMGPGTPCATSSPRSRQRAYRTLASKGT